MTNCEFAEVSRDKIRGDSVRIEGAFSAVRCGPRQRHSRGRTRVLRGLETESFVPPFRRLCQFTHIERMVTCSEHTALVSLVRRFALSAFPFPDARFPLCSSFEVDSEGTQVNKSTQC